MIHLLADIGSNLEHYADNVQHLWPLFVALSAFLGMVKVMWKSAKAQIISIVDESIKPVLDEVKTNGGGSIKDSVNRLEQGQAHLGSKIDNIQNGMEYALQVASTSSARMSAVAANLDAAYYEIDADGGVTTVNDSYLKLFGITEKEALSTPIWRKFISDDDLDLIDRSGTHSMATHTDWYAKFTVHRDGVAIPVTARAKPMFGGKKEFVGFAGAMTFDASLLPD